MDEDNIVMERDSYRDIATVAETLIKLVREYREYSENMLWTILLSIDEEKE